MQVIVHADQRPKQNHKDVILPVHPQELCLLGKELGLILTHKNIDYPVSKKLINILCHGSLPRDNDGAIEFWRTKDNLQTYFPHCPHWSDDKWKACMAGGGGNKKIFQYCTDSSGTIRYLQALQGHSGRNLIDFSCRTKSRFWTVSSSTFVMSDVPSIYIPSSIQD